MEDKKPGDIFISKMIGCKLITRLGETKGRCAYCIFRDNNSSSCIGLTHKLRQHTIGHCSSRSRKDGENVYFEVLEKLYDIPEETKKLIEEIDKTNSLLLSSSEILENIDLLLNLEYLNYKKEL